MAYSDVMITTGPLEGTNHKIKTRKQQSYGSRDQDFFEFKVLGLHESPYEMVG